MTVPAGQFRYLTTWVAAVESAIASDGMKISQGALKMHG